MKPLLIEGMKGLGDSIYQRAFVKTLCRSREVYIATPWPEIYEDLPVKFANMTTPLRTQAKNLARQSREYHQRPANAEVINPTYGRADLLSGSIVKAMQQKFGCLPEEFDLPTLQAPIKAKKPICVVRPATVRREWTATARNPEPQYIFDAIERIRNDYYVVSVADISGSEEYALQPLPSADLTLHAGELDIKQLLGLIQSAKLVIGGVGWIVPACIASKTSLFCILGGNGGYNAPHKITDIRMDLSRAGFATPDNYCMCTNMKHNCNKKISNFTNQFEAFLGNI